MIKNVFIWLFMMTVLFDTVIIILKITEVISWSWGLILALPFAVAIAGTLLFSIFYLLIKIFVWIALLF